MLNKAKGRWLIEGMVKIGDMIVLNPQFRQYKTTYNSS
jgi:hypothetical protein